MMLLRTGQNLNNDSPTEDTYQEMKKMTKSIQSMDKSIQKLQKRMDAFDSNRGEVSNE